MAAPLSRIVCVSALTMFLEMLVVRWLGTEVRAFAYLQNGVLIAAFLGLGFGFRNAQAPARLLPAVLALAGIAFVIRDPLGWGTAEALTQGLMGFQDTPVWSTPAYAPLGEKIGLVLFALLLTFALLGAVAWSFGPLGQWLGAWMDAYPRPVPAYSANIVGSLLGIALFVGANAVGAGPVVWLAITGVALAMCAVWATDGRAARGIAIGLALALPLFAWPHGTATTWSPYQKLSLHPIRASQDVGSECGTAINVNNVAYMAILDLDPARFVARPDLYPPAALKTSHYLLPYELIGRREQVLVVGAGAGNDVAAALRNGAAHVDAVEIDPAIIALGRKLHPNQPYASPRVSVTEDDARAFFRRARGGYDLVWFGLLDSQTNASSYANVRLDHFVYTRESLADVKRLLKPSGVVVLLFAAQTPWISDRLISLLEHTFGYPPLVGHVNRTTPCLGWGGLLLIAGSAEAIAAVRARADADPQLAATLSDGSQQRFGTRLTTDDWPYLYLAAPGLPRYHLVVAAACLLFGLLLRRWLFRPGEPVNVAMMLLGMGFMLLEVVGVCRAALLFGATWQVNAYVIAAIFAMTLGANLVATYFEVRATGWPAAGLLAAILLVALAPVTAIAALPLPLRVTLGGAFLVLPVFFSGLVFVKAWATTPRKDLALGSNILGALLGGVASMLSMVVGFRALAVLTLVVYLAAWLVLRRSGGAAAPTRV